DTGNAAVGLVVDEQVLAVVLAVGHGDMRVVAVAGQELGAFPHDGAAFVGQTPAGCRVDVEYRNTHQLAHGRHAQHTHFALVTARPEAVIVVQLAWADMDLLLRVLDGRCPALASHDSTTKGRGGNRCTGYCAGAEEAVAAQAELLGRRSVFGIFFAHGVSLLWGIFKYRSITSFERLAVRAQGSTTCTGINCGAAGAFLSRRARLFLAISGGHLFSL